MLPGVVLWYRVLPVGFSQAPKSPTSKESDLHEAIHLPHAEWCEFCVRGRSRNKIHPSVSLRRKAAQKVAPQEKEAQQAVTMGPPTSGCDGRADASPEGTGIGLSASREVRKKGREDDSGLRHPSGPVPRISFDYFPGRS